VRSYKLSLPVPVRTGTGGRSGGHNDSRSFIILYGIVGMRRGFVFSYQLMNTYTAKDNTNDNGVLHPVRI
jgi:hypothetical protein